MSSRSIIGCQPHHPEKRLIITIDGPAGVGKSTVAKRLALRLGYRYADTGALYRAVAWKVSMSGIDPSDHHAVAQLLSNTSLILGQDPKAPRISVDGKDVTDEIRTAEISRMASIVSAIPAVREWLIPIQRRMGMGGGVVVEGRDIGTRIFPAADMKFFLEADQTVRATRRHHELASAGETMALDQIRLEIENRDTRDRSRPISPLVPAPDATIIDTTSLGVEQVVDRMMSVVASKL